MPQLKYLIVGGETDAACIDLMVKKFPRLERVSLNGSTLPDEAISPLLTMQELTTLRFVDSGCVFPVTAGKMRTLSALPRLTALNLYNSPSETFSPELASELRGVTDVMVNFTCSSSTLGALVAMPSLKSLTLSRIPTLSDGDLSILSKANHLEQVILFACPLVSPAALDHFSGVRSLKKLSVTEMPAFTEAHLAAFRNMRQDVEVETR